MIKFILFLIKNKKYILIYLFKINIIIKKNRKKYKK